MLCKVVNIIKMHKQISLEGKIINAKLSYCRSYMGKFVEKKNKVSICFRDYVYLKRLFIFFLPKKGYLLCFFQKIKSLKTIWIMPIVI